MVWRVWWGNLFNETRRVLLRYWEGGVCVRKGWEVSGELVVWGRGGKCLWDRGRRRNSFLKTRRDCCGVVFEKWSRWGNLIRRRPFLPSLAPFPLSLSSLLSHSLSGSFLGQWHGKLKSCKSTAVDVALWDSFLAFLRAYSDLAKFHTWGPCRLPLQRAVVAAYAALVSRGMAWAEERGKRAGGERGSKGGAAREEQRGSAGGAARARERWRSREG